MTSQKVQKLIAFDRKTIVKMLDLDKETTQRVMNLEIPSLKTKKSNTPGTNKDGFPRKIPGYMLYCNAFRDKLREADGKLKSPQQCMKDAAAKWKVMEDEEKNGWLAMAIENFNKTKEEFLKEHPNYENSKKSNKQKMQKVKPDVIKAPRMKSAKKFFVEEFKSKSDLTGNIALGEAEKAWEALSEDDREPYNTSEQKTKDEVVEFKEYAKTIKEKSLKSGVEDTMKALRDDAAKRWHELKNNSSAQNDSDSDSDSDSDCDGDSDSDSDCA